MKNLIDAFLCVSVLGCSKNSVESEKPVDVLLIGGGIASATPGYLSERTGTGLDHRDGRAPGQGRRRKLQRLEQRGHRSPAFCELNYTSEAADGSMDISKAVAINENFEISKQFWAYQVDRKVLNDPKSFITTSRTRASSGATTTSPSSSATPPCSSSLFRGMEYSEDPEQIKQWVPLVMEGREPGQKIAATRMSIGTDVNFGEITRQLVGSLSARTPSSYACNMRVRDLKRNDDNTWTVTMADLANGDKETSVRPVRLHRRRRRRALKLLQMSGIPRPKATPASRWAVRSSPPPTRTWSSATWPRSTERLRWVRRRCRCRTSTPA